MMKLGKLTTAPFCMHGCMSMTKMTYLNGMQVTGNPRAEFNSHLGDQTVNICFQCSHITNPPSNLCSIIQDEKWETNTEFI